MTTVEHGKAANLARLAIGQTSPQGGSAGAALGGPKKPRPACNALDTPTSVWSDMAERKWNRLKREKQMTTDTRRLMRLGAVAPQQHSSNGRLQVSPSHGRGFSPPRRGFSEQDETLVRFEPYDWKLSSTVLR